MMGKHRVRWDHDPINKLHTIFSKCDVDKDCWIWAGAYFKNKNKPKWKYPQIYYKNKNHRGNRLVFELMNGWIDKDLYICHKCDNSSCINPDHLYLGTSKQNAKDAMARKRNKKHTVSQCPNGHLYTEENTKFQKQTMGRSGYSRVCRKCKRAGRMKYYYEKGK